MGGCAALTQAAGDDIGAVLGEDKGVDERQIHGGVEVRATATAPVQCRGGSVCLACSIFAGASLAWRRAGERKPLPRWRLVGSAEVAARSCLEPSVCLARRGSPCLGPLWSFLTLLHHHPPHPHLAISPGRLHQRARSISLSACAERRAALIRATTAATGATRQRAPDPCSLCPRASFFDSISSRASGASTAISTPTAYPHPGGDIVSTADFHGF